MKTGKLILWMLMSLLVGVVSAWAQEVSAKPGYAFITSDIELCRITKYDADGKPFWVYDKQVKPIDVWALPDGTVLIAYLPSPLTKNLGGVRLVDAGKKTVFGFPFDDEIMSVQLLDNGNFLMAECHSGRITEMDRKGNRIRSFNVATPPSGHKTVRQIRLTPKGTIVAGECYSHKLREYARDGKMLREIDVRFPYYPVPLPNGKILVACWNHSEAQIVEFDPTGKIVWNVKAAELPAEMGVMHIAGVVRLPNGNTLVSTSVKAGKAPNPRAMLLEITPDKKIVWQMLDKDGSTWLSTVKLLSPEHLKASSILSSHTFGEAAPLALGQWSVEQAWAWYRKQPWLVGFNYVPSTACNTTEWWQEETFDPRTIDRELGWAHNVGFNTTRVFIQYIVWKRDPNGFKKRFDAFLALAAQHGISVMPVLFDDCTFGDPHQLDPILGKQRELIPGMVMPSWTPSPGRKLGNDPNERPMLKQYMQDLLTTFGTDQRVLAWDLYNEPMNTVAVGQPALLEELFTWATAVRPDQPITVGIWNDNNAINPILLNRSDVVSFHCYGNDQNLQNRVATLQKHGRPLLCTEWMARLLGSRWETDLPLFKKERVGCYCWGLVNGRTQTQFGWNSKRGAPEPKVWFHDLFHKDGTPYDQAEIAAIQRTTGFKQGQ